MDREGEVRMSSMPKNVRQIGQTEGRVKVYVEDYVNTYMKKLQEEREETGALGFLIGHKETEGEILRVFFNGAIEYTFPKNESEAYVLAKEGVEAAVQIQNQYFPGQNLCGIFACEGICKRYSRQKLLSLTKEFFHDFQEGVLFLLDQEGEEFLYQIRGGQEERLGGYYCYYERNEGMQEYMMDNLRPRRVEKEVVERGTKTGNGNGFPQKDPQKLYRDKDPEESILLTEPKTRGRKVSSGGMINVALCGVMAAVVVWGGVSARNGWKGGISVEELLHMLYSFREEGVPVSGMAAAEKDSLDYEKIISDGANIIIEEIPGNVETLSETDKMGGEKEEAPKGEEDGMTKTSQEIMTEEPGEKEQKTEEMPSESEGKEEPESQNREEASVLQATEAGDQEPEGIQASAMTGLIYIVKKGDSLYSISRRFYGTETFVKAIQELNHLSNADLIKEGQSLILP